MDITIPLWITWAGCTTYINASDESATLFADKGFGDDDDDDDDDDDNAGDDDDTTSSSGEPDLAGGLTITKVSLYQGVESVLYENGGAPSTFEMPVIVGRPGLLRVHVEPDADFEPRRVDGILTITSNDGEEILTTRQRIEEPSRIGNLDSTINFEIDGELIKQTTEFKVEIREIDTDAPGGGKGSDVRWRSEAYGGLNTEATDELQIVIIPIRYNYDGSGRLPDTSATQIQRIEDLAMGVYPATNVTVRVDPPLNWNQRISPFDVYEWSDVLTALNEMRADANEPPNTYYYGMFNPEPTINQFCAQGCILGLSLLGYTPNNPYFRASIGIGYTGDFASETLVHEVGHAHGRDHAPCGLYGQPSDPNYPYSGADIGSWGYHIVDGVLLNPQDTKDMMSYCSPIWVSDYTFYSLFVRMQAVAGQNRSLPMVRSMVSVAADGTQVLRPPREMFDTTGAPRVDVQLFDERGNLASVTTGAWFPYDHAAGGLVVLDEVLPEGWTAQALTP